MNSMTEIPLIRRVAAVLREMLGDDDDEAVFLDTLDGETDALRILDLAIEGAADAAVTSAAIRDHIDGLQARLSRFNARKEAHRATMLLILDAMGLQKVERPMATVSRRSGQPSVSITDPAAIPSQLCKTTVAPDLAAIKAQLAAGEFVPGAEMKTGPESLTVRVK